MWVNQLYEGQYVGDYLAKHGYVVLSVDDATILEDENNSVADYSVSASDYYCEVLKKENTVLYVTAYHDYELEAKKNY